MGLVQEQLYRAVGVAGSRSGLGDNLAGIYLPGSRSLVDSMTLESLVLVVPCRRQSVNDVALPPADREPARRQLPGRMRMRRRMMMMRPDF